MNTRRQTNTFSGGLNMDVDYSVLKIINTYMQRIFVY